MGTLNVPRKVLHHDPQRRHNPHGAAGLTYTRFMGQLLGVGRMAPLYITLLEVLMFVLTLTSQRPCSSVGQGEGVPKP